MAAVARPTSEDHTVDQDWLDADANALERKVVAIQNWLAHTDDLIQLAEMDSDEQWAGVLRGAAGFSRERRNGRAELAREIRAASK